MPALTSTDDLFVEVALPVPLRTTFTYKAPREQRPQVGSRVLVPFGRRMLTGYVLEVASEIQSDAAVSIDEVRFINDVIDPEPVLTSEIIQLARWTADYYLTFIGEVLRASLPAGINKKGEQRFEINEKGRSSLSGLLMPRHDKEQVLTYLQTSGSASERQIAKTFGPGASKILRSLAAGNLINISHSAVDGIKAKRRKVVRLIVDRSITGTESRLNAAQLRTLDVLANAGGRIPYTQLLELAKIGASPIKTLEKKGLIEIVIEEVLRDPLSDGESLPISEIILSDEQQSALEAITGQLDRQEYKGVLLHGVTGSGKTEVYFRAMRAALDRGRSALMLVPEIALTPVFSKRLRAIFGIEVAILHSSLSPGERFDEWRRIRSGGARIVIGTRSAVFAPLVDLGLVIVDEEHDASYRQHESPFYHARDVAVVRARSASAVIVLGSATPSLETYYNAKRGKYSLLCLPKRVASRQMPAAEIVDMREVFKKFGKDVPFSPQLLESIEETQLNGEQSMILLNRRGYSQFVLCRTCGESIKCRNCEITLTYHRRDQKLVCHYCSFEIAPPVRCPTCQSEFLYFVGEGTEKVEDQLRHKFPKLRIGRIDRDTVRKRRDMERILTDFSRGQLDLLVGTQMIAKGHDFPNVTLVGVISVDLGLGLPDFRSAERTFQLLTQVAGRSGRGEIAGRVLIQTYHPDHYALKHAQRQDYDGFYNEEIRFRQRMGYPPFYALASIMVRHSDLPVAAQSAGKIRKALDEANSSKACRVLGPAPASISRLKGEYRLQILIKSPHRKALRETVDLGLASAEQNGVDMRIVFTEIDPINLM